MTLAEERAFELRVRGVERAVVPVEAATALGRREQERQDDRAEECLVLVRARPCMRAREDARRGLAPQVLDREARVLAPRERGRARLEEGAHERAVLVQRRTSERLVLLERERKVLVDESLKAPSAKPRRER